MSSIPVYGYCMLVGASLVALFAMSTDFFVAYVNDILIPCQHDSVWLNNRCVCDNTAGVFAGTYCDECQCEHLGICGIVQQNLNSRWGCRCPSHQKWVGTLCDKCYAVGKVGAECRGNCIKDHFGTKCNTVCLPYARSTNGHCQEVTSGGGECNACNGHGECNNLGGCDCDSGYFTSLSGEQCLLGCEDAGITCHNEGGTCMSIGGKLQCICNANYFGKDCDMTCPGVLLPCSGHGSCSMDAFENLICTCSPHFTGEDCSLPCPGQNSYPTACSGHGQCVVENEEAICECSGSWESDDCSCSATYSCSGHGTCNDDASCECFDESPPVNKTVPEIHFAGGACERCQDHWFGETCQLRCDPARSYNSSVSDGLNIGCNNHGSCELVKEFGVEHILCLCISTDPDTFCETCMPEYYPDINLPNMTIAPCSVECNPQTCSYNGICNEKYDGTNNMCICDTWENDAGVQLDTLDPLRFCSTCKPNWFPSDMGAANRCSEYCAADGELQQNKIIVFPISSTEVDYELDGDIEAAKVCSVTYDDNNNTRYTPDPDCRVCSGEGKCMADGTCKCSPGTTGEYCDIQCNANADGTVCSGHGRCIRNALDMWFNPFTSKYRCECTPYDTYTSETRQRLLKRGFQVEPPPAAEFYGKHCGFHCPRYNEDVCTGRGSCETGVAVATSLISVGNRSYPAGSAVFCKDDEECHEISGAFCARLSTPWDSLMDSSSKSFFSNGHDSPGYFTCASSDNCIDSIYSIEWDLFCVNMLNGWYPPVLNTAECVYNEDYECRESVEDFFMNKYDGDDTWCESAEKKLMPPRGAFGVCGDASYANEEVFLNDNVPICLEYTIDAFCNAQPECIYDQRISYIRNTDDECDQMKSPCSGRCQETGDGTTCETKTYCRAKMCSDIMFEHNVEKMCIELDEPCEKSGKDWQYFCADAVGKIRVATTLLNSMETFFGCYMYDNRNNPQRISASVPGGIPINGILSVFSEDITVSEFRQSFIESRIDVPESCNGIVDTVEFCKNHLTGVAPGWYNNPVISTKWFLPWIVVCERGAIGLVQSADAAFKLIESIGENCKEHYRNSEIKTENENNFAEAEDGTESLLYTGALWTKQCLDNDDEQIDTIKYSEWSEVPSRCVSKPNDMHQRWGQQRWTPSDVQREFSESCQQGLDASWIPVIKAVPTLCDMDICGNNAICTICDECEAHVVYCSKRELGLPVNCKTENPCQKGAHCFQLADTLLQSAYYCDVTPPILTSVTIGDKQFEGRLSNYGQLTIMDGWGNIPARGNVTFNLSDTLSTVFFKQAFETTPGNAEILVKTPRPDFEITTPAIHNLSTCHVDINWYRVCSDRVLGVDLNTAPPNGLSSHWSGYAALLSEERLQISSEIVLKHRDGFDSLDIVQVSGDGIRTDCDGIVQFWPVSVPVTISTPFLECKCRGIYGPVIVSTMVVNGTETIKTFRESLQYDGHRQFNYSNTTKESGYKDWYFEDAEDGVMSVRRARNSTQGTDNNKIRGARWTLDAHSNLRISGWARSTAVANMRLLMGDGTELVTVGTIGNGIFINDEPTNCRVVSDKWWYWQINAEHIDEVSRVMEISGTLKKVFDQRWKITVKLDNIECKPLENAAEFTNITTSTVELKLHSRIAAAFHDIPSQKEHECRTACHEHEACHQWSWTIEDQHCFLHSSRCHEDENCMHGTHTLRALHSHPVKYFEVSTSLTDVTSSWARIRAEPIITMPSLCETVDSSIIDPRWRSTFEDVYEPFNPDVTAVCNSLKSTWRLMPGYKNAVCGTTECVHDAHDLKACALWKETHQPVIEQEQCLDVKKYNWTAYCHYRKSFDSIGGRVPFLGGLVLGSIGADGQRDYELDGLDISGGMEGLCNSSRDVLENATVTCPSMDVDWFSNCFERTAAYEDHCSGECLIHIENMLESTENDTGLCEKRKEFLDISTDADDISNGLPAQCKCNMKNVIVTDFCLIQNAYHDENTINIPELYNSECSYGCIDTLKDSMNRTDWRKWCSDLSDGTIPGVCSKTSCSCDDVEFPGVSGPLCELTCPTGISDGKELACSGRNGQCFAIDPDELKADVENQQEAGETRNITLKGYDIPTWMKGPDPNMPGRCQCAIGSGLSCSIPCYMCNNGVYGPEMSSQYGICDSFNGICRAFPSFMRYNTKQSTDNYISEATTAFESAQGISKWSFPERFLYESDEKMVASAIQYLIDPNYLKSNAILPSAEITITNEKNVKDMLRIWPLLCSLDDVEDPDTYNFESDDTYDFGYLSNSEDVINYGIKMGVGEKRTLKLTQGLDWGSCQKIDIDQFWYLCFESGQLHGYDTFDRSTLGDGRWNDTFVNMSTGRAQIQANPRPTDANAGPLIMFVDGEGPGAQSDMSFAIKDDKTIYAFGGHRKHDSGTTALYDVLYKISFERIGWDPADVVFINWEIVTAVGPSPAALPSKIWCFQRDLFIVNIEGMYRLILPSSVREGQWSRADLTVIKEPVDMVGSLQGNLYVSYGDSSWTYNPTLIKPWFSGAPPITNTIGLITYGQSYGNNAYIDCFIEVTNSSLLVGGKIIATFEQPPVEVELYLEEWNSISQEISPVQRIRNTIIWNIRPLETGLVDLNLKDRLTIVDLLERVYMHQARWSIYNMMWMKYHLSTLLDTPEMDVTVVVHIEPRNTPDDEFLELFKSVSTAFFGQLPNTEPDLLKLSIEGEQYQRSLVISANYDGPLYDYKQEIDFDSEIIVVEVNWDLSSIFVRLQQKFGRGYIEWFAPSGYRTWHLLLHLEEWQNSGDVSFHSRKAVGAGAFQLYAMPEYSSTQGMDFQMSNFLHYSASHCTLSADGECPGTLPYINLPCSGRGRCNIACQCTCEIAKSVLESTDNALSDIDPINSPWRGKGCELTCPGYDGYNLASVCSDRGTCQADGTCSCPQGFTGDACQFECPTDNGGRICSAHGGCGTKAYELSSFKFKNEQYTDMLAAINRNRYSSALSDYYGSCVESNYVEQSGVFGSYTQKDSLILFSEIDAFKRCTSINNLVKLDLTQELYRQYPIGKCIGIQRASDNRYVSVILKAPVVETRSAKSTRIFDCLSTDCSIEIHEDDDLTIYGIRYKMIAPSFEFDIEYVHGGSSGRTMYHVNDQVVYMDIDWTTTRLVLSLGSDVFGDDIIIDREGSFERVKIVIEAGEFNAWVFPFFVPTLDITSSVYIAPRYDVNYETIIETLTGYHFLIPSDDTGYTRKLFTREVSESSCDAEPDCLGIIRWDVVNNALETLYSLYTDVNNLNGWVVASMTGALPHTFIKKMSLVYQGRKTSDGKCAIVKPGLSKYPTVVFREDYNIPIKDIDISLAQDPDTSAVIIGDGYWSKCWSNIKGIHTKMECYTYAKNANVYGFSFSDETNICLVYTGIKDNTKIKLDRYNSESRLSIFDPCEEDASWFT